MSNKVSKLIPMEPKLWEAAKLIARSNERSTSAQIRFWVREGVRMAAEEDRLALIEANAKVIDLHEDRTA